jgi:hypothetical protein
MDRKEMLRVEAYLRDTFRNEAINLRPRQNIKDSVEVYMGSDFIGVVSKDEEDGETSYQFNMAILDIDLDPAK